MENFKRRKICTLDGTNSNNPVLNVEFLPNEILMNIFSHVNINDLYKCTQVSKKFRQISQDKSFWKCVNLYDQDVSCDFISQIIRLGTEYLNLQGATLLEDVDTDLPRENNLKYLNLAESSVDDKFIVKLLRSSKSLKKLSLAGVNHKHFYEYYEESQCYHAYEMLEVRTSWYLECLIPNAKMLTTLDLKSKSMTKDGISFDSIKEIILVCDELKEANFEYLANIDVDPDFFAENLTTKIEKLNISYIDIRDEHMVKLLKRCRNITELDLFCCHLNRIEDGSDDEEFNERYNPEQRTLMAISENLSQSLVKLHLPYHSIIYPGFLDSLPKLKYLWHKGSDGQGYSDYEARQIKSQFPHIALNEGEAQIANCAIEYFEPKLGFWELKCTAVDLDFPKMH